MGILFWQRKSVYMSFQGYFETMSILMIISVQNWLNRGLCGLTEAGFSVANLEQFADMLFLAEYASCPFVTSDSLESHVL